VSFPAPGRPIPCRGAALVVVVLLAAGMAACAGSGAGTPPAAGAGTDPTVASGQAASAPEATTTGPGGEALGSGRQVTFAFGGDVHFEQELRRLLDRDPADVLATQRPVLSSADIAMVNLETAITTRGTAAVKDFTFRAPPAAFTALAGAGVDVATMANNHGLDYGPVGLTDTLAAAKAAGFPIVGIGLNAEQAYAPWRTEVNGQRIAVIGATQVIDSQFITSWSATDSHPGLASAKDVDRLVAAVRAARADSDTVVVYLHWGTERVSCPNPQQKELAAALQQAGADIIIGGHAHVLLGAGMLDNAFVAYGLGNFFFYATAGNRADSGVVTVQATGRRIDGYQFVPAHISGGQARTLTGVAAEAAVTAWTALRPCTGLTP
jgi:poly-gamma-glutamate capsule biosynthesis protein CapA/YwtB (metallophosphatase superfamily)